MAQIASGVDPCCYRHVPYDVINKRLLASFGRLSAENAKRFAKSLNDIVFIDISAFTACFELFMYRINNELELNRRNNSTYLEGPFKAPRGVELFRRFNSNELFIILKKFPLTGPYLFPLFALNNSFRRLHI